jgi:hypothetical protein
MRSGWDILLLPQANGFLTLYRSFSLGGAKMTYKV